MKKYFLALVWIAAAALTAYLAAIGWPRGVVSLGELLTHVGWTVVPFVCLRLAELELKGR